MADRFIFATNAAVTAANAFAHTFDEPSGGDNFAQMAGPEPFPGEQTHWWCRYSNLDAETLAAWETYAGNSGGAVTLIQAPNFAAAGALMSPSLVLWEEEF